MANQISLGHMDTKTYLSSGNPSDHNSPAGFYVVTKDTDDRRIGLRWDICNSKLIQANAAAKLDWEVVLVSGLLPGHDIQIDGLPFWCRIPLSVQDQDLRSKSTSWDEPFWEFDERTQRGIPSSESRQLFVRLVLEPRPPALEVLEGHNARLLTPSAILDAKITEAGPYDLACRVLKWRSGGPDFDWGIFANKTLYITKEAVLNAAII